MTLQEILKAKGLTDAQIQEVLNEMKTNKIFTASEENLDIRYGKLKTDFDTLTRQHGESTATIEQMKKDNAGNQALQQKIGEYEQKVKDLEAEALKAKIDAELRVALIGASAVDVDYLTFKVKEKGELKLNKEGKIEGIDDAIASLKTQFPTQFTSQSQKKIEEKKLPVGEPQTGLTKKDILSKSYAERMRIYQENPDKFNEIMKSE